MRGIAARRFMSALGHKRTSTRLDDMSALPPNSGHQLGALECPLCAISRHSVTEQSGWSAFATRLNGSSSRAHGRPLHTALTRTAHDEDRLMTRKIG
jgi:hypothetical protein